MKAIVLTAYGDVDKLEPRDVPDPKPGAGAILVAVAGASINPVDWKMRSGAAKERFPVEFPGVLGRDASGEVAAIGAGVTRFAVGDRVLGLVPKGGTYAELVAAPEASWAKVPEGLDVAEAGALPLVLLTGAQLADAAEGDTILVTGAAGSVGRAAIFTAKKRGSKVWAGVRGAQRAEAEKLGADGVVALDDEADLAKLPVLDAIADTVGGDVITKLYAKLKPGGTIGTVVGEPKGAKEKGFTVHAFMAHPDPARLGDLAKAVADGALAIPIARTFPLAEAREAQSFAETKHPRGKVLMIP
jgi:NADPH:quinone reductase-like Zn-dependent oxidoreductase